MPNLYDERHVDVEDLHTWLDSHPSDCSSRRVHHGILDFLLRRRGLYGRLVEAGLIREWFEEFRSFWVEIIGGRPIKLHDFFYLHGHYRSRFAMVEVDEGGNSETFMQAWRHPANIYTIFGTTYKYALDPMPHRLYRRFLPKEGRVLEYGCGIAPMVTSLVRSGQDPRRFTIADIRNFTFLYAKWRLRSVGVHIVDIEPFGEPSLDGPYSAILLLTVLEHLPDPVRVVDMLLRTLRPDGVLIFDYIKSEGTGLDTVEARDQREEVLSLLDSRCELVSGQIKLNESMGTTVMRLKS